MSRGWYDYHFTCSQFPWLPLQTRVNNRNLPPSFSRQNSLTCSLPSVPIPDPCTLPPNRGLLVSPSTPPTPPSGDSSTVVTWFKVAWGLEITVEFFMFSAVVTGACLLVFPPNNLRQARRRPQFPTEQRIVWQHQRHGYGWISTLANATFI